MDPGGITIPLCDDPEVEGRSPAYGEYSSECFQRYYIKVYMTIFLVYKQVNLGLISLFVARGVLTLSINGGSHGKLSGTNHTIASPI